LSVVIPTYNDAHRLELTLRSLTRQTLPAATFEVIVVRDGDGPGYDAIKRFHSVLDLHVVILPQRRGRAAARNEGIGRARGETVLFLDSDSYAVPGLLERHHRAHRPGGRAVLLGLRYEIGWPQLGAVLRDEPLPAHLLDSVDCRDIRMLPDDRETAVRTVRRAPWMFTYTHNVSVSRDLLMTVGGFDEQFGTRWGWEDLELFYRVYLALGRDGSAFDLDVSAACYHLPHYRDLESGYEDYRDNEYRVRQTHPNLDWEFAARAAAVDVAEKVHHYRKAIADCVASGACRLAPVWEWVGAHLPAVSGGQVLWIGTGTAEVPLVEEATTFDYGRPPSVSNRHLIGVNTPFADATFDAVVSVDFWRCLSWTDLCGFVAESLRVATTLTLVCTDTPLAATAAPTHDGLVFLSRTLGEHFETAVVGDDSGWPAAIQIRRSEAASWR
jgi:glycosyltransferase involved in cell wall biosynthesis